MELIIGGAYNSKLNFALKYYNLKQEDFQNGAECNLNDAFNKKGIYNLHLLIRRFIISGINDYNKIIEAKNEFIFYTKNAIEIIGDFGSDIFEDGKEYIKEWYDKFKGN